MTSVFPIHKGRRLRAHGRCWYIAIPKSSQASCRDYSLIMVSTVLSFSWLCPTDSWLCPLSSILFNKKCFVVTVTSLSVCSLPIQSWRLRTYFKLSWSLLFQAGHAFTRTVSLIILWTFYVSNYNPFYWTKVISTNFYVIGPSLPCAVGQSL